MTVKDDPALLHLFSPTALSMDLSYIDKAYYELPMSRTASRKSIEMSQHSLHSALFNRALSLLTSMSRLDLHSLNLLTLPSQISSLSHLTQLDLSHNQLTSLPASIQQLKHLRHLNLSHNRLTLLPPVLGQLKKLTTLNVSHNSSLDSISSSLSNAIHLTTLDISFTNIDTLPAELACLLSISMDQCPRIAKNIRGFTTSLQHDPPSLVELCARHILATSTYRSALKYYRENLVTKKKKNAVLPWRNPRPRLLGPSSSDVALQCLEPLLSLPSHLWDYMQNALPCTFCGKPFVEACVPRYRIIQRLDESLLPIRYCLCCAHWSDENDRLLKLFSSG
ncbi:L domain-like protein [Hesseltinella vesiculosa]|uniref:L domain-like protein n=1 Tax=Hesseltinella vesiculosa TaxID=101127 RepID=A0A1X2G710_9FUNG|nr:L domain-like protein [Hesseltinella vesiculosa]